MSYAFPKAIDIENLTEKNRKKFDAALTSAGFLISPKFDGCAVHIEFDKGLLTKCESGSGGDVRSIRHLAHIIAERLKAYTGAVDAEAWKPGASFQQISGEFRRHQPSSSLCLRVWDGYLDSPLEGYASRMRLLEALLPEQYTTISVVKGLVCYGREDAELFAKSYKHCAGDSYDGAVLHHADKPYTPGRAAWDTVKVKPLLDYDLIVTGVRRAVGERTGRDTCALECAWAGDTPLLVATGLDHAQQENPEQFIGKVIRVYGMARTDAGMLREPRFGGLSDKTPEEASYPLED